MKLKIKKLDENAIIPKYKTPESAGMDLSSTIDETIDSMEIKLIPTGLSIEMEKGYEAQVRPRSGIALKGITVVNSPGTIDSDYRGEIKIILMNLGKEEFKIVKGDRIAQLIISKVEQAMIEESGELNSTERGDGGFGSTGIK
ncbi:MAG: dUTP diphosphatase [Candidatus Nanoarchaeia archaeon]|nr:dUTP diphosphatase [Candidatus Nanoarchaeia archaeon]MDD5054019.1 dUTP diphosphatase [Candidatus Nanoarchaeia archaeon]MDD5499610.1 dUTP diphosphatase [Candidatus Nanoarchaeia archaeon]